MEKRYQVFVSSTYEDLREERRLAIQTLMEMDCLPAGMELFPAADEEQWNFIKRIIDDCDYYLLIIGGRYGSITLEGISYTEREYDYAVEKGLRVVALLHSNLEEIAIGKSEIDPERRSRLVAFREKVSGNRLVKFWENAEQLPGLVALNLAKTITMYPAVGWIRADRIASSAQLLEELNQIRKQKEELEAKLSVLIRADRTEIPDLASLDDMVRVTGSYTVGPDHVSVHKVEVVVTWKDVFSKISPYLLGIPEDFAVKSFLATLLFTKTGSSPNVIQRLDDEIFQTIKIQFLALDLISMQRLETGRTKGLGMGMFWSLTDSGRALTISLRSVKSKKAKALKK